MALLFSLTAMALINPGIQDRPPPPPPPPLIAPFEDWGALQPVAKSDRVSVLCRAAGRITAEFSMDRQIVSVANIDGISHRLTPSERVAIDAAVKSLGYLDRVEIGCNGPDEAAITVLGAFSLVRGKMMRRSVTIVWRNGGMTGTGGRAAPEMELNAARP
jgi:hypothetical protein